MIESPKKTAALSAWLAGGNQILPAVAGKSYHLHGITISALNAAGSTMQMLGIMHTDPVTGNTVIPVRVNIVPATANAINLYAPVDIITKAGTAVVGSARDNAGWINPSGACADCTISLVYSEID